MIVSEASYKSFYVGEIIQILVYLGAREHSMTWMFLI